MNIHKKLISIGFKRCEPHKPSSDWRSPARMVVDNKETKSIYKDGKWTSVEKEKIHPKWQQFYLLEFDSNLNIWIKVNRDYIKQVWLQGNEVRDKWGEVTIKEINIDNNIKSKSDIMRLLPKRLQRDLIINDLFK